MANIQEGSSGIKRLGRVHKGLFKKIKKHNSEYNTNFSILKKYDTKGKAKNKRKRKKEFDLKSKLKSNVETHHNNLMSLSRKEQDLSQKRYHKHKDNENKLQSKGYDLLASGKEHKEHGDTINPRHIKNNEILRKLKKQGKRRRLGEPRRQSVLKRLDIHGNPEERDGKDPEHKINQFKRKHDMYYAKIKRDKLRRGKFPPNPDHN